MTERHAKPATAAGPRPALGHARALVGALVLLGLCAFGYRHAGELGRLLHADLAWLALVAALVVAVRWVAAQLMRDTLAALGHPLRTGEVFGLAALGSVTSMLVPRAGFGALGLALRTRHGVPFSASSALALPLVVLDLILVGAAGLSLQLWLAWHARPYDVGLAAVFAAALAGALVVLFLHPRLPYAPARLAAFLANLADAWTRLRRNRAYLLRALALLAAVTALRMIRLGVAYRALGFAPGLDGVVLASLLGDLSFLIGLTPGGLGLREAAIVYGARVAGVTPEASLAAALLDRLVMTLVLIALAQGAAWRLFGAARDDRR